MGMNIYLEFLGCRLNEAEQSSWTRQFQAMGHQVVANPEDSDVMALNTCAVTSAAAKKSRKTLRQLHRKNPQAKLVATGCYATLSPEKIEEALGVDMIVPNADKSEMAAKILSAWGDDMPKASQDPLAQPSFAQTRTRAFIKVQDGCRNSCSFCIVTKARGEERSRKIPEIVEECNQLHTMGFQEIVITGVHLGGYGEDIGENLRSLIESILEETSIPRIRIGSLEPWDFPEGFYQLWENPRLCPHLHLPLQSGSDKVLRRMIRRCSISDYKTLVREAKEQNPFFHITSDLIIGFPGETEEEFQETLQTIQEIGFGDMHLFTYSPREGTAAVRMSKHVSKIIKKERLHILKPIVQNMKQNFQQEMIGREVSVLWERDLTHLDDGQVLWKGYTENYLRVQTIQAPEATLFNQCTKATISHIENDVLYVTL